MPSLIDKLKQRRSRVSSDPPVAGATDDGSVSAETEKGDLKPPEFKFFRQSTQDLEPLQIDTFTQEIADMSFSSKPAHLASSSPITDRTPRTPTSQMPDPSDSINGSEQPRTPPRSGEKRISRRLLSSLTRRPSQMSNRSRSSSYVPEFMPIDSNTDVEAQWEQRATMLARAGPPSPAIARNDSIFDAGPPRLAPIRLLTPDDDAQKRLSVRAVSSPERQSPARQTLPPRAGSHHTRGIQESGTSTSISEDGTFEPEGQSKDDLLQSAIREHERGNLEISTQLFKKSAQGEDGLPMGQLMYGLSLRHGWGIDRDEARAIHWLRLAASSSAAVEEIALSSGLSGGGQMKGDLILAIFELGNCFRHGWGVSVDKDLARNYYETAANLGDSDAMYEVAWCYETGFGIKKDKYKAAFWYRKSETNGNKIPGMQWIWKPKYDHDPFTTSTDESKEKSNGKKK